jgi:hypothetical protein
MSVDRTGQEPEQAGSVVKLPEPYPWCLACGFKHTPDVHCAGCNGDHSAGYCMTDELAAQLAGVGDLQEQVTHEADRLIGRALQVVRQEGDL